MAADYRERNVARQEQDTTSMLSLYRALARLRRAEPSLYTGDCVSLDAGTDNVFAYQRSASGADRFLIILNFIAQGHVLDLSRIAPSAEITMATDMMRSGRADLAQLRLDGNEGLVLRL